MLPSAKSSLVAAGFDPKTASWILIACFLGGFVGIQVVSRALHHFVPSHVVDCEHSHDDDDDATPKENGELHDHGGPVHDHASAKPDRSRPLRQRAQSSLPGHIPEALLQRSQSKQSSYFGSNVDGAFAPTAETETENRLSPLNDSAMMTPDPQALQRRPSLQQRLTARLSRITSGVKKDLCDSNGPCYGFGDVCGTECFKNVNAWGGMKVPPKAPLGGSLRGRLTRTKSLQLPASESTPLLQDIHEEDLPFLRQAAPECELDDHQEYEPADGSLGQFDLPSHHGSAHEGPHSHSEDYDEEAPDHHHHHVPNNAFLSIGLQTSIAIALHKLPEGFITYATNHANPKLGFSVFLALFIHNITEGFAMALPLYLALNNRLKAMLWSFVLGGLSQPLGAAVAALWFKIAGNGDWAPSEGVYGGMFAVTSGIMVSVALQLFSESLDLTHNRTLCMIGAVIGMAILGISSALTA